MELFTIEIFTYKNLIVLLNKLHYIIGLSLLIVSCNNKSLKECSSQYDSMSFVISDGFTMEYNSQNEIFIIDHIDSIQKIPLKLNEKEIAQIKTILCDKNFNDMKIDNRVTTKMKTIVSGPPRIYKLRITTKDTDKVLLMNKEVEHNNKDIQNKKFIEMWGEIWDLLLTKEEIRGKLPQF